MKTLVVGYSLTGNNRLLAEYISGEEQADLEMITAQRKMSMFSIALDALFNRSPQIGEVQKNPADYDTVILAAPIWMGKIASPLRRYVKRYRAEIKKYGFISVSGGALGKNEKVPEKLQKLMKKQAVTVKQLYINDILPESEKADRSKTSEYAVMQADLEGGFKSDIDEFILKMKETGG